MSFWKIAWRNMEHRVLASALTAFSMALGVAVMICVIVIHSFTVKQFEQDAQGYHLIVGGKGGSLQLVLSTVYHLGEALYPIPYKYYEKFLPGGEFGELTKVAVPYCLGDSFATGDSQFRVVGTTPDLFDKLSYGLTEAGDPILYKFSDGENFKADHFYEAVIGSVVASQSGLKVGDTFNPTHGLGKDGEKHESFKITGILAPTGTANDRAVFVNMEGFYLLDGHSLSAKASTIDAVVGSTLATEAGVKVGDTFNPVPNESEASNQQEFKVSSILAPTGTAGDKAVFVDRQALNLFKEGPAASLASENRTGFDNEGKPVKALPIAQREVTSILVLCTNDLVPAILDNKINKGEESVAQAVAPARQVTLLLDRIIGPLRLVLMVLTILIIVVASISILVSIYNSMNERKHDIAVMRALGESRVAVMLITLFESILLAIGGGLAGILLGHGLIALASPYVEGQTGIQLQALHFDPQELILLPALVILASLVGFLPAIAAYRTDVSKSLS